MCSARLTADADWLIWCVSQPTYHSRRERIPFLTTAPAARSDSTGGTGSMKVEASTMRSASPRSPPRPATGEWARKSSSSSRSSFGGRSPDVRRKRTSSAISAMTCSTYACGSSDGTAPASLTLLARSVRLRHGGGCVAISPARRDQRGVDVHPDGARHLSGVHHLERPSMLLPVVQDAAATLNTEGEGEEAVEQGHIDDAEVHDARTRWCLDLHPDDGGVRPHGDVP